MNENEPGGPSEDDEKFVAPETGEETENTAEELDFSEFLESEEMTARFNALVEAIKTDSEEAGGLKVEWKHLVDEKASQLSGGEYDRAMIKIIIAQANIWRESGNMDDYYDDLEQAREYADNMDFEDVVKSIDKLLA